MQFSAYILRNNRIAHPPPELAPHPGKSWIRHWHTSTVYVLLDCQCLEWEVQIMGLLEPTTPRQVLISSDVRWSPNVSRWSKSSATNRFLFTLGFYTHSNVGSCRKLAGPEKLWSWAMINVWYLLWGIIWTVIFLVIIFAKKKEISSFAVVCSGNDLG